MSERKKDGILLTVGALVLVIILIVLFVVIFSVSLVAVISLASKKPELEVDWKSELFETLDGDFAEIGSYNDYIPEVKHYINPNSSEDESLRTGSKDHPWKTFEEAFDELQYYKYANNPVDDSVEPEPSIFVNPEGKVKAGHALILLDGNYGTFNPGIRGVYMSHRTNTSVPEQEKYLYVLAEDGHTPILEGIKLQSVSYMYFKGLKLERNLEGEYEPEDAFVELENHGWNGYTKYIYLSDLSIETLGDQKQWNSTDWIKVSSGIKVTASHVKVENCYLHKVSHGIPVQGHYNIIANNVIDKFLYDATRVIGSSIVFEDNQIMDNYNYHSNGWHNDGLQSFILNEPTNDYVILQRNLVMLTKDFSRNTNKSASEDMYMGYFQGFGCFDGPFSYWLVQDNIILVNHWHGMTFNNERSFEVINNYILPLHWTKVTRGNEGPPHLNLNKFTDCTVEFNTATSILKEKDHLFEEVKSYKNNTIIPDTISDLRNTYTNLRTKMQEKADNGLTCQYSLDCLSGKTIDYQQLVTYLDETINHHSGMTD